MSRARWFACGPGFTFASASRARLDTVRALAWARAQFAGTGEVWLLDPDGGPAKLVETFVTLRPSTLKRDWKAVSAGDYQDRELTDAREA